MPASAQPTTPAPAGRPMPVASGAPPAQRLASLDAFRGFTLFGIVGGKAPGLALAAMARAMTTGEDGRP